MRLTPYYLPWPRKGYCERSCERRWDRYLGNHGDHSSRFGRAVLPVAPSIDRVQRRGAGTSRNGRGSDQGGKYVTLAGHRVRGRSGEPPDNLRPKLVTSTSERSALSNISAAAVTSQTAITLRQTALLALLPANRLIRALEEPYRPRQPKGCLPLGCLPLSPFRLASPCFSAYVVVVLFF